MDREQAFNTIYLGGDVPRSYERAVMRKTLTYDSFHRHARGSARVAPRPRRCPHPDEIVIRRQSMWRSRPLSMSIVEARIVPHRICLSIATRALRLIPRHGDGPNAIGRFARIRLAPAFIKGPPPPLLSRWHNRQIPEAAGHSRKAVLYEFWERVYREHVGKKRKVDRCPGSRCRD